MGKRAVLFRTSIFALAAAVAVVLFASPAHAGGGDYSFDGGNAAARANVRAALEASTFDWDAVPVHVTIHIRRDIAPRATPGDIWLDGRLLRSGRFAWGIVQHEYAHQVAYFLVGASERRRLVRRFGARAWCYETRHRDPGDNACEEFAELLTWAHWPSRHNVAAPAARPRVTEARVLVASALGDPS